MMRETIGKQLAGAREAAGFTVADVARTTKIPVRTIELIEAGETAGLPADVFVRGFVTSYAKALKLDGAKMAESWSSGAQARAPREQAVRMHSEVRAERVKEVRLESAPAMAGGPMTTGRADANGSPSALGGATKQLLARVAEFSTKARAQLQSAGGAEKESRADSASATSDSGDSSLSEDSALRYRASLTVAVIVLVLLATITLSLLLRQPSETGNSSDMVSSIQSAPRQLLSSFRIG